MPPRSNYGPALVNGQVQYFSASSLTLGDADSNEGCLRKYWYEKVEGRKSPSTKAQEIGTRLHEEIEGHLRTGAPLGQLAARGKPMIPERGLDLLIEHDIMISPTDELVARDAEMEGKLDVATALRARASLALAPLRIRGIPMVGFIDLVHGRCTNKGVSDIEDTHDPVGTVEIIDWKTSSNVAYIKSPAEMSRTIQMTVYGKWVTETLPDTSHVRLSHGYFFTRGATAPCKVTQRLLPEVIDRQWERIEKVAGSIIDAAREMDVDKVPANTRACSAYGGCPHRSYCRAGVQESLVSFFGPSGADHMLRRLNNVTSTSVNIAARQPRNLLGLGVKPVALQDEIVRLAREEIETKYPGLPAVWDELVACNSGNPIYEGDLAIVISTLSGALPPTNTVPGVGTLATFGPFSDPLELPALLEEVKLFLLNKDACVDLLPPDAPASDPAFASEPQDTTAMPSAAPVKRGRGRPKKVVIDSTAPAQATFEIMTAPVPTASAPIPATYEITTGQPAPPPPFPIVDVVPVADDTTGLYFYVNCAPSRPFESFWPMVHELIADLNTASNGVMDFRLVPTDHKFAYGKWKAAIAAALNAYELAPGHYVLNGVGGEVGLAVVEAMRTIIAARGGTFIQ